MAIAIPTYEELLNNTQQAVQDKTGITNFSESSVAGALIKVYVTYLMDLYDLISQLDTQGNLSTASGDNLDKIGELFGVTRLQAKSASSAGAGNTILFRNTSQQSYTVPRGTRIWSAADPSISYITDSSLTLSAGGEGYVDATAVSPGDQYNVGVGSLTMTDLGTSEITVTNVQEIGNGAGIESDDNYRYRISNALLTMQGSNETSIRIKLLEIPGVKDVILQPMARGTGTIDVTVLPVDSRVSDSLLAQVQYALDDVVAFGISAIAKAPVEVPMDFSIRVSLSSQLNASTARALVDQSVRSYVDNLTIGDTYGSGSFIYNELISRIMDAHPDVTNCSVRMVVNGQSVLNTDLVSKVGQKFYVRSISVL